MNRSIAQSLNSKRMITIGQDNDLSEFDESRDIIESLVDEYKACESPDYIKWGMEVRTCIIEVIHFLYSIRFTYICFYDAGSRPNPYRRRKCIWDSRPKFGRLRQGK